jgi:hypothetical protein
LRTGHRPKAITCLFERPVQKRPIKKEEEEKEIDYKKTSRDRRRELMRRKWARPMSPWCVFETLILPFLRIN